MIAICIANITCQWCFDALVEEPLMFITEGIIVHILVHSNQVNVLEFTEHSIIYYSLCGFEHSKNVMLLV